jgi:hypothetical protein
VVRLGSQGLDRPSAAQSPVDGHGEATSGMTKHSVQIYRGEYVANGSIACQRDHHGDC